MLTRYRRVNVEGARLLLGQWWDVRTWSWLPLYPDLIAHPRHTPAERRVLLYIEDACAHARPARDDGSCVDCGECRHYRLQPRGPARHLRPPVPGRPASTRCAPAPLAAPRPPAGR